MARDWVLNKVKFRRNSRRLRNAPGAANGQAERVVLYQKTPPPPPRTRVTAPPRHALSHPVPTLPDVAFDAGNDVRQGRALPQLQEPIPVPPRAGGRGSSRRASADRASPSGRDTDGTRSPGQQRPLRLRAGRCLRPAASLP